MLADSLDGLFSGVSSVFGRMVLGFLAVAAAAAICFIPTTYNPASNDFYWPSNLLYVWIYALPFMLIGWANCGVFFLVGLVAVVTLISSYFVFVQDIFYSSRQSFYTTFAAAVVYYFPITLNEPVHWIVTIILFALLTLLYWSPPTIAAFLQSGMAKLKSLKS